MVNTARLFHKCEQELSYRNQEIGQHIAPAAVRCPASPLVSVFWPGTDQDGAEEARAALREIWAGHAGVLEDVEGICDAEQLWDLVKKASARMRGCEGRAGFQNNSTLIVAHYISTEAEDAEQQIQTVGACAEKSIFGINGVCTLVFLMCDDNGDHPQAQKCIAAMQRCAEEHAALSCVYLSNVLQNGVVLTKRRMRENYRIAADCCILADSVPQNDLLANYLLKNKMMTVSYMQLRKPVERITAVVLRNMIDRRKDLAKRKREKNLDDGNINEVTFCARIRDGLACVEKLFTRYQEQFPAYEALFQLPYWSRVRAGDGYTDADQTTMGFLRLFVQRNYVEKACRIARESAGRVRKEFRDEMQEKFDYRFIDEYFAACQEYLPRISVPAATAAERLQSELLTMAKRAMYDELFPCLQQEMLGMAGEAHGFSEHLDHVRSQCVLPPEEHDDQVISVDDYYQDRVAGQLDHMEDRLVRTLKISANPEIVEEMLYDFFRQVVRDTIYLGTFEDELAQRLNQQEYAQMQPFVAKVLKPPSFDTSFRMCLKRADPGPGFCMINARAEFRENLNDAALGTKFEVSGTNSAERLKFFSFRPDGL